MNTKNKIFPIGFVLLYLLLCSYTVVSTPSETDIIGKWINPDKDTKIEFFQSDKTYQAKVFWKEGTEISADNPKIIIKDLTYKSGNYENGKLYLPKKDQWIDCEIRVSENGKELELTAKKGWLSKTIVWQRITE